ncbi:putative S-adenosyl-L-methionine-dependent methyltransferase [Lentzea sp. NBRC 105346]|uniref:SAM-dependent methyltransferase n=1 Tax=Lentzea sp. NBRC 105346 TaxID=3032205 RepID=UPI0025544ED7|nr:SAM-dependent methyltransferase [Lentzea sp. NBRC 105346]GLZ30672.1 putative S-adenosyl-L-methionine-dependent methyltransferase [Lentzea sp. NBRC 105346]
MEKHINITTEVDVTALVVAATRAIETNGDDPLFKDHLAAEFIRAAGVADVFPVTPEQVGQSDNPEGIRALVRVAALRTRFLDDYFAEAGLDQVVILAAGLDTRAFRLDWPAGCTLFELDHGSMMDFKQKVLDQERATCDRRAVSIDLRTDWPDALTEAGFDPERPTAWLAEGLLPFLPPAAEENLFDRIHELSAAGSTVAVWATAQDIRGADQNMRRTITDFGVDIKAMTNTEPRQDARERLTSLGWKVTESTMDQLGERYRRPQRNHPVTFSPLNSDGGRRRHGDQPHDKRRPTADTRGPEPPGFHAALLFRKGRPAERLP